MASSIAYFPLEMLHCRDRYVCARAHSRSRTRISPGHQGCGWQFAVAGRVPALKITVTICFYLNLMCLMADWTKIEQSPQSRMTKGLQRYVLRLSTGGCTADVGKYGISEKAACPKKLQPVLKPFSAVTKFARDSNRPVVTVRCRFAHRLRPTATRHHWR